MRPEDRAPDRSASRAVRSHARLCVARAWLTLDTGQLEQVEPWIEAAERGLRSEVVAGENCAALAHETAVLRAVSRFKAGDIGRARAAARRALETGASETVFSRTVAHLVLGVTLYWSAKAAEAAAALEQAERLARSTDNNLAASYSLGYRALRSAEQGEPDDAHRLAQAALCLSDEPGFAERVLRHLHPWDTQGADARRRGQSRPDRRNRGAEATRPRW